MFELKKLRADLENLTRLSIRSTQSIKSVETMESEKRHERGDHFPRTRLSVVEGLASEERGERSRAFDTIVAAYWRPVYAFVRIKYRQTVEDAQDLTQGFFAAVHEKGFFDSFDPTRARFRTFLRTCLDRYVANQFKAASRLKRGGDIEFLPLDFHGEEIHLQQAGAASGSIDEYFEREWVRSVLELSMAALREQARAERKTVALRIFEAYDLQEDPEAAQLTYRDLAERFDLPVTSVTNYLADMRRRFRVIVLQRIRELTGSDDEYRREVRAVLGIDAP